MNDAQFAALLAKLDRVADALERHTEATAALFGLLVSADEQQQTEPVSTIPKTLED